MVIVFSLVVTFSDRGLGWIFKFLLSHDDFYKASSKGKLGTHSIRKGVCIYSEIWTIKRLCNQTGVNGKPRRMW